MPRNPSRRYIRAKAGTTGITNAGQLVITAADAAAIRVVLELVIGTHVLAPNGNGSGLTGLTQSQISGLVAALAAKADAAATAAALDGKADLVGGKIQTSQIPSLAIVDFLGSVSSQSAMLALDGDRGDWCIRTDAQTAYILTNDDSTQVGSWIALPHPTSPVLSVNGQTGVIVLGASDVGAQPVDATLTALAGVATSADKLIYATGSDTFSTTTLSAFARTFLDDADAAAVLATLGAQSASGNLTATITGSTPCSLSAGVLTSNGTDVDAVATGAANRFFGTNSSGVIGWYPVSSGYIQGGQILSSHIADATIVNADVSATANIDATKLGTGQVDNSELNRLNGCVEDIQPRLDSLKIETLTIHDTAPVVGSIYLDAKAQIARTINGLYGIRTTSGTATLAIKINGTAVTGLSAVSVTSTPQDVTASALNTVAAGDVVTLEYTAVSSPVDLRGTLKATRT